MKINYYQTIVFFLLVVNVIELMAQEIDPILTTQYRQTAPYNNSCPGNSVAGCGPLAVAQILVKYKQPLHGYESVSYISGANKYVINVNFEDYDFDWKNIIDNYDTKYVDLEAKAVADLVFACGAAMRVSYGASTSVKNYAKMLYGLHHNLHISEKAIYLRRQHYSTAEWLEMINQQLRLGHPIFYRGTWLFDNNRSDHMFVIDGLNAEGKYHVNFGHGGRGDKFTDINILNQSGTNPGGRGVCYNSFQAMVINCYPTPDYNNYPLQKCISEESVVLNRNRLLRKTIVKLGERFTLSCRLRNYCLKNATINYGWALIKDGRLIKILQQQGYRLRAGNQFAATKHLDLSLPVVLEEGNYILSLYSKSDINPKWAAVWESVPSSVYITVKNDMATITVPDNHSGDALLYISKEIAEIKNSFSNTAEGRVFALDIINPSTNNFMDTLKLEIVANNMKYIYKTCQPIYSQSQTAYHILVPQSAVNLKEKIIKSIRAYYYNSVDGSYKQLKTTEPTKNIFNGMNPQIGDITFYTIDGKFIKHISAKKVATTYGFFLRSLPCGVYIVKEGREFRKIII